MYHNLDWYHELEVEYDASTFDTDPFEPQPDSWAPFSPSGYLRFRRRMWSCLHTAPGLHPFILMGKQNIDYLEEQARLDRREWWQALMITHPIYMNFNGAKEVQNCYPPSITGFSRVRKRTLQGQYWNGLPRDVAKFWKPHIAGTDESIQSRESHHSANIETDNEVVCLIAYTFYEVDFRVRRYARQLVEAATLDVFA